MSQAELRGKAAECARAINATCDPTQRQMLTHLREVWVQIADDSLVFGERLLAAEIEAIREIHARMIPTVH
jgi:hypothetical protein